METDARGPGRYKFTNIYEVVRVKPIRIAA